MPTAILEPIEAGLIVAFINKYIISNDKLWDYLCGTTRVEEAKQDQEDASSTNVYKRRGTSRAIRNVLISGI